MNSKPGDGYRGVGIGLRYFDVAVGFYDRICIHHEGRGYQYRCMWGVATDVGPN